MSSPPPSLPPQPPAALPAAGATGAVTVANQGVVADPAQMPPALAKLVVSDVVAAQVLSTPAAGMVQLQTPQGPVTLKLPMVLPLGVQVTLQVVVQGAQPQFRIATVDGQPVTASGQIHSAPATTTPTIAAPAISEPPAPAEPPGIKATVLNNPTPTAPPSPQALPPGTALTLQLVQVTPPATAATAPPPPQTAPPTAPQATQAYAATQSVVQASPQPVSSPIQPMPAAPSPQEAPPAQPEPPSSAPQAAPTTPAAPITQAAPSSAPAAPPPTATATPPTATTAPPAAVSQPAALETSPAPQAASAPTPPPAPTAPPPQIAPTPAPAPTPQATPTNASSPAPLADGDLLSGTVPASSRPASPLVDTPAGLLSLQAVVDLPPGSQVDLRLVGNPTPPPVPTATPTPAAVFPDLQRTLEQINLVEPQLAEQISRHLPRLSHPRLAFQLLALTTAVRSGTADSLTEDEGQQLLAPGKARPHGLLALLEEALSSLASPATLPGSGQDQWQSYVLPLFFGDRMEQMRLVVRDPPQGKEEAAIRDEQGTRFLMDLDMTNLGPVQLDGLVKGRAKRFDLIIRTHDALAEPLRQGITEVFTRTLDGFGMTGKTSFQQTPKFIEAFPSTAGIGKSC